MNNGTRRLNQNQLTGKRSDLPLKFVEGAQYIAYDTRELFIYDYLEDPILIATSEDISLNTSRLFLSQTNIQAANPLDPKEWEVQAWNDSIPEPFTDLVCYYTGSNVLTHETIAAFHIDMNGAVTKLGFNGTPVGITTYTHDQGIPSISWDITHNLDRKPSITVVDTAETVVFGQADYINNNRVIVTFNAAFSGKAFLN